MADPAIGVAPNYSTLLVLAGMGVPRYSARGITQTLAPIAAKLNQRRTVNGVLTDLSVPQFAKYASEISGADCDPPACDGVWQGQVLTVTCIAELSYQTLNPITSAANLPQRPVVAGSSRVEGSFTFYRPILTLMVSEFSTSTDEWGAIVTWSLKGEEV